MYLYILVCLAQWLENTSWKDCSTQVFSIWTCTFQGSLPWRWLGSVFKTHTNEFQVWDRKWLFHIGQSCELGIAFCKCSKNLWWDWCCKQLCLQILVLNELLFCNISDIWFHNIFQVLKYVLANRFPFLHERWTHNLVSWCIIENVVFLVIFLELRIFLPVLILFKE